MAKYEMKLCMC